MENNLQTALSQLVEKYIKEELPESTVPYHYQAEGAATLRCFSAWLKTQAECINGMGDGVKLQDGLEKLFDDNENYISGYTGTPVIMSEIIIPKIVALFKNQFPPESSANAMQREGEAEVDLKIITDAIWGEEQPDERGWYELGYKAAEKSNSQAPAREVRSAEEILYNRLVTMPNGIYDDDGYNDYMSHGVKEQYIQAMQEYANQFK